MSDQAGADMAGEPKTVDATENTLSRTSLSIDSRQDEEAQHSDDMAAGYRDIWKGWRLLCVQLSLITGLFLSAMDSSIVSTSLVTISVYFDDFPKTTWVVISYLLTYMGFAVISTRVSDAIGRRMAVIVAWIIFAAASLGCAVAQTLDQLIIFRAFQGIGGSALFSMTMVTVPEITPPEKFGLLSSMIGMTFAASSVLGPIVGGAIVNNTSWRWIFYINLPISGIGLGASIFIWPQKGSLTGKTPLLRIDFFGSLLLLAGSALIVFALQQAGATEYKWNSPTIIATLVVGSVCWVAFFVWVAWLSQPLSNLRKKVIFPLDPIVPMRVLKNKTLASAIVLTGLSGFPFILLVIQLPVRFQLVNGLSPIGAGVHLLPLLCLSALGSALGGLISSKKNRTFQSAAAGAALMLIGLGLMSTLSSSYEIEAKQYGFQILIGLGIGLLFSSVTVMIALTAEIRDVAVSQGAIGQTRMLGGAIALAISTIVFNHNAVTNLSSILTPQQLSDLQRSPSAALFLSPQSRSFVRITFAQSFNDDMKIATYVAAVGFLVSLGTYMRHPPSIQERKKLQDDHFVARKQAAAAQSKEQA